MAFRPGQATPIRVFMEALEKLSPVMHMVHLQVTYERDITDYGFYVHGEPEQVRVSIDFIVPYKAAQDAGFEEQRELNPGPPSLDN